MKKIECVEYTTMMLSAQITCLYTRDGRELPRTKMKQGKLSRMPSSILYKEITKEREEKNISLGTSC